MIVRKGKETMGIQSEKYVIGNLKKGKRNLITDVPGVKVGHVTLCDGAVQTGVTAVIPGPGSAFREKFPAAVHVINGFGKSAGLMQVEELGTLETPILLTNTFSVAACLEGLLSYMLEDHPEIGRTTGSVNAVVTECNDSVLNDIRGRHVKPEHALDALKKASEDFEEGAVGAGRGMKCYGWKGGIGSASRVLEFDGREYTVGSLVLTNFGKKHQLTVCGRHIGEEQLVLGENTEEKESCDSRDNGSCIVLIATDLPLSARQLKRCTHRAQNGLARTGAQTGGGSGEIVLMFSTANRVPHSSEKAVLNAQYLFEDKLDDVFTAVADTTEEGLLSALFHAKTVTGRDGNTFEGFVRNKFKC